MCTMIAKQVPIEGSGKGRDDWFQLRQVNISYDHPYDVRDEHALNIDFVNEGQGPGARVAVELTAEAARRLAKTIQEILAQAEAAGHISGEK